MRCFFVWTMGKVWRDVPWSGGGLHPKGQISIPSRPDARSAFYGHVWVANRRRQEQNLFLASIVLPLARLKIVEKKGNATRAASKILKTRKSLKYEYLEVSTIKQARTNDVETKETTNRSVE
uniref:Uncharacterized protein n=1 Tax=Vespula pensylvanica TaxID=30213 RepID=A0A834UDU9_VESPE|nr:hypothetical protein H0235_002073 [Vespula pensylvanica]